MARFDSFVILAGMRTGSNYLESSLAEIDGITCHGELFNPHFIGKPGQDSLFGIDLPMRARDPLALLARMAGESAGLPGFRFFRDHDVRVLDHCLGTRRCAKIVLTRNPVESFVSLQQARATGQWRLGDLKTRRAGAKAWFDEAEFALHLAEEEAFRALIARRLRRGGQSCFEIDYDELGDVALLNGLARFLGVEGRLGRPSRRTRRQNPEPLDERVANPDDMYDAVMRLDPFALTRHPRLEPGHGAGVHRYVAAARAPLLYMSLPGVPAARIEGWLAALDGVPPEALRRDFTRQKLAGWRRATPGARSFTVVCHPLARAHRVFWQRILATGDGAFNRIRRILVRDYAMPLPPGGPDAGYDTAAHRAAFLAFLRFLKGNLAGQSGVRTDPHWASQSVLVEGMAALGPPDFILRDERGEGELPLLAAALGMPCPAPAPEGAAPIPLAAIWDSEIEEAARAVYEQDYARFGYRDWPDETARTPGEAARHTG